MSHVSPTPQIADGAGVFDITIDPRVRVVVHDVRAARTPFG